MSMLKVCWPGSLTDPKEQSIYFHCIGGYFLNICDGFGVETRDLDRVREDAVRSMRNLEELSERAETFVGATLVADAHWTVPFITWMPWYYRIFFRFVEDVATEKLLRIARNHSDVSKFRVPDFSFADELELDGEPAVNQMNGANRTILGGAVMHTQWFGYVADELGIEVSSDVLDRSIEESMEYLAGRRSDLPDDVARFQAAAFRSDAQWLNQAMDEFSFSSFSMRRWARFNTETAERFEEMSDTD